MCVCAAAPTERQSVVCRMKVYLVILIRNICCNGKKNELDWMPHQYGFFYKSRLIETFYLLLYVSLCCGWILSLRYRLPFLSLRPSNLSFTLFLFFPHSQAHTHIHTCFLFVSPGVHWSRCISSRELITALMRMITAHLSSSTSNREHLLLSV